MTRGHSLKLNDMEHPTFARRIRFLLWREDLNYRDLAQALGRSEAAVSHLVNGKAIPRMETLERLSRMFEVRSAWLLGDGQIRDALNE